MNYSGSTDSVVTLTCTIPYNLYMPAYVCVARWTTEDAMMKDIDSRERVQDDTWISDVQHFVEQAQTTDAQFILTTSLPFRELRDESQSLEEADLANAVIVQRPLNTQAPFGHS
ncbi:UBX domain-containing protein 2A [Anabarilius grahami]|uniref:UBX domain-containing protein 2A n=1 Tax=Anabarilius grahami TaxID=495550 RepID=A0A3N0Z1N7_ANAGA|nr:UBX domain-containing protein 2A [Anabarilius grahami]